MSERKETGTVAHMITTTDNPFDPRENFLAWYHYDSQQGYNTPAYLARLVFTSYDLSDADQEEAIELAIDEIINENPEGNYMKLAV